MVQCSVITNRESLFHDNPSHPENEARLINALTGVPDDIKKRTAEPASVAGIEQVHNHYYLEWLRNRCSAISELSYLDSDTYITPRSFGVACHAAGAAIAAVERSLEGEHCFSLVRPPGHHAESDRAMGFCLINNAAVAAANILDTVDRVAIVDWDVHHGNGTQHAFYNSAKVLYCSIHQEHLFPFSGALEETGVGAGKGFTINAPLQSGSGTSDYVTVFKEIFAPAIARYEPDVLIVSAGQDILADDPLGGMRIRPEDFGILTGITADAAGVPLALILEGGYGESHGKAVSEIIRALRSPGSSHRGKSGSKLRQSTVSTVSVLKKVHRLV